MAKKFCGSGCLRLELDENGESLREKLDEFEDSSESGDTAVVTAEQLQKFQADFDSYATDFAEFQSRCAKCTNFKSDGKAAEFSRLLTRVRKCLGALQQSQKADQTKSVAVNTMEHKEGTS